MRQIRQGRRSTGRVAAIRSMVDAGEFLAALSAVEACLRETIARDECEALAVLHLDCLAGLGRWQECIEIGEADLTKNPQKDNPEHASRLHGILGYAFMRLGSMRKAESHLRAAIHILTWDLHDIEEVLREQRRLSLMFKNLGYWRQAQFELEKAIDIADEHNVSRESGSLRVNLAIVLLKTAAIGRVRTLLEEADRSLSTDAPSKWRMQANLVRANYLRITGHPAKALEILATALQTARDQQYSREEAISLEYTGDCHLAQKEYRKALDCYGKALKIGEATAPEGDIIPEVCHRMGEALVNLGDPNQAILLCERGLRVARAISDRYEECATHRVFAMAHRAAGNPRKALRIAEEGVELGRRYEIPYELGRMLAWAGEILLNDAAAEEQAHGRRQLWEARGLFERIGLPLWVRAIDRLLGFDFQPEPSTDEPGLTAISDLPELDRGALRFGVVTCDGRVQEAVEIIQSVAPSDIPVLIYGESGVGKELLAHALHKMSARRKGPFIAVNCGAISVSLLESEFFGHERGAFTGAVASREGLLVSADTGTLFLDEVGELPPAVQASLLRVLESGEVRPVGRDDVRTVNIRIVAATNARLEDLVDRGLFRQDLFYRLNGVRVGLPPLRDREEDVRALFRYFFSQAMTVAKKRLTVGNDVEALLCGYDWPGNVRELKHEIARVVALAPDGSVVERDAFLPQLRRKDPNSLRRGREIREEIAEEREQILLALRAHRGNKTEAARSLGGMKRTTLIYKIGRLGIRPDDYLVNE